MTPPIRTGSRWNAKRSDICARRMGFDNVIVMIPFCRNVEEADRVLATMAEHGLERGKNGLQVYVMCEVPSNVIEAEAFAERFDGFSIGSNDLTQLTLGVDRDSEALAHLFNERDPAVLWMINTVIAKAHTAGRKVGLCGQAPSNDPRVREAACASGDRHDLGHAGQFLCREKQRGERRG